MASKYSHCSTIISLAPLNTGSVARSLEFELFPVGLERRRPFDGSYTRRHHTGRRYYLLTLQREVNLLNHTMALCYARLAG